MISPAPARALALISKIQDWGWGWGGALSSRSISPVIAEVEASRQTSKNADRVTTTHMS